MKKSQRKSGLEAASNAAGQCLVGLDKTVLAQAERRICAIDAGGRHVGTGFLIGPTLLMTCYHVYAEASGLGAVFDHDGKTPFSQLSRFAIRPSPLAVSPADHLDYAILELEQSPSGDREFFELTSAKYSRDQPIHVLGYPGEVDNASSLHPRQLTHTSGILSDHNNHTRKIAYTSQTAAGMSGSPVFTQDVRLVGIHHHGEREINNHGIPMWAILDELVTTKKLEYVRISERSDRRVSIPHSLASDQNLLAHVPKKLRRILPSTGGPAIEVAEPLKAEQHRIEALRYYLEAVVRQSEALPVYIPPGTRLENIRVQVRVRTESEPPDRFRDQQREVERRTQRYSDGTAYAHRHGREENHQDGGSANTVEVYDWDDRRDKLQRAVILADPGLGKSWLLKWEARRLAIATLEALDRTRDLNQLTLPVFLRFDDLGKALADLSGNKPACLDEGLKHAIGQQFGESVDLRALLDQSLQHNRCVLLLDAWDEASAYHGLLKSCLRHFVEESHPRCRLWLTSRIVGQPGELWRRVARSETDRELELQPFAPKHQDAFIRAYFPDAAMANRVIQQLDSSPQLYGLSQVPLLLAFLCKYVLESRDPHFWSSLEKSELYRFIIDSLLERARQPQASDHRSGVEKKNGPSDLRLLGGIAFRLLEGGRQQFSHDELCSALRDEFAAQYRMPLSPADEADYLNRFESQTGLLTRAGRSLDSKLLFLHLTIHEYLVAHHLLHLDDTVRSSVVGRLWDHPAWSEVWDLSVQQAAGRADFLEVMARTVVDHAHRLDAHLWRPELTVLNWLLIARITLTHRTPTCTRIVEWVCDRLLEGNIRTLDLLFTVIRRSSGQLPDRLEAILVDLIQGVDVGIAMRGVPALAAHLHTDRALFAMLAVLQTADPSVKSKAAVALSRQAGRSRVQTALLGMLTHVSQYTRAYATQALEFRAHVDQVQSALLERLDDPEEYVRNAAVYALASEAAEEQVQLALLERLNDSDHNVCEAAIAVLAPHAAIDRVQRALLKCLVRGESSSRFAAAKVLSRLSGSEPLQTRLLSLLKRIPGKEREIAIHAFESQGSHARVQKALLALLRSRDAGARYAAVIVLSSQLTTEPVQMALLKRLSDPEQFVREVAVKGLAGQAGLEHVQSALLCLLSDVSEVVRTAAVKALSPQAAIERVQSALLEVLSDSNDGVRVAATKALSPHAWISRIQLALLERLGDSATQETAATALGAVLQSEELRCRLLDRLEDPDAKSVNGSIIALTPHATSRQVYTSLLKCLNHDSINRILLVASLCGGAGHEQVQAALLQLLEDKDAYVRAAASSSLASQVGKPLVQAALERRLSDGYEVVRRAAVDALSAEPNHGHVSASLLECLNDSDESVSRKARTALVRAALIDRHTDI